MLFILDLLDHAEVTGSLTGAQQVALLLPVVPSILQLYPYGQKYIRAFESTSSSYSACGGLATASQSADD